MRLTIPFDEPEVRLHDMTHVGPLGEVLEVKGDVVGLGERVEVAVGEFNEVSGKHRAEAGHCFG